jgi:ABC-type dipeptide/oligopeptide/nickel transport system permease component
MVVDMKHATPAEIAQARHALGVDRPVYVQYGKYVWRALHGDLGDSWASQQFFARTGLEGGQPVRQIVWQAAKVTIESTNRSTTATPSRRRT